MNNTRPTDLDEGHTSLRLGIFARTFRRDSAAAVASAVRATGYGLAHWNFAAIGLSTLAEAVTEAEFAEVRTAFDAAGIVIPSVSATFNMIHPDQDLRARQTAAAVRLIGLSGLLLDDRPLGSKLVITLCTGTREPDNMWRAHPDNTTAAAWSDMLATLETLLEAAGNAGVLLGVEPEHANVIHDAPTAAKLLIELGSDAPIGIVLDPANLLTPDTIVRQDAILGEAVDLLGAKVVGVQAKDVVASGYSAPGAGLMNYPAVFAQLRRIVPVPIIVQDADEHDAARVFADLLRWSAVVATGT